MSTTLAIVNVALGAALALGILVAAARITRGGRRTRRSWDDDMLDSAHMLLVHADDGQRSDEWRTAFRKWQTQWLEQVGR